MTASPTRRRLLQLAAASPWLATSASQAQPLPEQLRVLCGFPAGGSADAIARWVGDKVSGQLAHVSLVENRAGAGGRLAVEALRSARPDGQTLLLTPSSIVTLYPYIYANLPYDPQRDVVPVSQVCDFVHALAVGPAVPAEVRTLQDFAAWCRAHPERANCGNTGDGSMPHFVTLLLNQALNLNIEPIPYRGTAPGLNDLLGGQVSALVGPEGSFTSYVADGKLRLIGTSGAQRSAFFPDVPTFAEQGAEQVQASEWFGMFMPAGTPPAAAERAAAAIAQAVRQPDMVEKFATVGMTGVGSTPQALAERLQRDLAFWAPVVRASGFTPLNT